jgi:hypothetical protein
MKILMSSGVSGRMTSYLPSEVRSLVNEKSVTVPGGIRIPFGKKKP